MDKLYIKSEDLLRDSFTLAWNVFESGFAPNYIIGVWRGGAPAGNTSGFLRLATGGGIWSAACLLVAARRSLLSLLYLS